MAITVNDKNLGHATAYAYAKSKGYTGTEEEFAEVLANAASDLAEVVELHGDVVDKAAAASASADAAAGSASAATTAAGTATTKASEAAASAESANSSAQTATAKAGEAATSATNAAGSATAASGSASAAAGSASDASGSASAASASAAAAKVSEEAARESARTLTIDPTLTQPGQAAEAKATGDAIDGVKSAIDDSIRQDIDFETNGLTPQGTDTTAANRGRSVGYVSVGFPFNLYNNLSSIYQFNVYWFDGEKRLIGQLGVWSSDSVFTFSDAAIKYIRIGVKRVDGANITSTDVTALEQGTVIIYTAKSAYAALNDNLETSRTLIDFPNIMDGYLYYIDGTNPPKKIAVTYTATRLEKFFVPKGTIIAPTGVAQVKVYPFASDGTTPLYSTDRSFFHNGTAFMADQDSYWYVNVAVYPTGSGDIKQALNDVRLYYPSTAGGDQITTLFDTSIGANYVITPDMQKHNIRFQGIGGKLTYGQSFCKYNGYYFSTDGSHISKQNSVFSEVSNATLALGHGNSLQLGISGNAFVSGWNDNSVYEVDLDSLTITNTYALPTSGYTTVAVDDLNKVMYIFQRSTYPDTNTNYTLVVYDYDNNQVIRTTKVNKKFGGMQAVDFYNGKIFVACGLGSQTLPEVVPDRFMVFNTNGDLLAEYIIGDMANAETEGIFVDRDTNDLMVSYVNSFVYQLM